jgi:hypothetical protein
LAGKLRSRHFKFILCRPFFPCDHRPIRPLTVQTLAAPFSFSFVCHSRRESAVALAFAVAPLFVIPEGNLLLLLPLPLPPCLSFPKGICFSSPLPPAHLCSVLHSIHHAPAARKSFQRR